MVTRKVLEDILQEPLGPYRDHDILHETACQPKGASELVLYSFVLEHNGQVTGLDESEHPLDLDSGTVETELNLRAKEHAVREGVCRMKAQQLTLEDLFSERGPLARSNDATWRKEDETKLMVLIQGEKNLPAVYMNAKSHVPNGLLWSSKAHYRKYQIATMDIATYSRSQNFFWRWRLFALMHKICERHPYIPERMRTPRWFVEKYIADFSCSSADRHQRLIFDETDTDVDETGKTVTPRHLLRPHMSEILGLFAAQADWFILNNQVRRRKLFDFTPWERFAKAVKKQRKEAARQGVRWGYPEGKELEDLSSDEDSEDEHRAEKVARENPVIGKGHRTMARKHHLAQTKPDRNTKPSISSDSESDWDRAPGGAEYASDFSEPSDAEEDDSDQWLAEEEAIKQIPWQLRMPPRLPDVDGRWWCPLQECDYHIDLHNLTEQEERGTPEELVRYILQKQWRNAAYDEKVLQGFRYMVTNHYMKHFKERGVMAQKKDGRTRFVFADGRRRCHVGEEPIRGPMPVRGTLGGESRVVPIVHVPQGHFP